jgi:radical SAM protein with 4Fe4S-binding SPASM domain
VSDNAYKQLIERNFNKARPMNAQWEITFKCNHLCDFCYNSPTGQRELTTAEILDGLEKIADFGILYLTLTGGEPMVRPDFWKICRRTRELGFAIRLYTNGFLIDEKRASMLKEVNPFEIEISIHGAKPETHDKQTGIPGSLDRVIAALGHLHKVGLKTNLKCPITRWNQDELWDVRAIGDRYDMAVVFDPVITPRDDGDDSPLHLQATREFLVRYFSDEYRELRYGHEIQKRDDEKIQANCGTGRTGFTIDPYGDIFPCVQWRRRIANIKEVRSLDEIWKASDVLHEVRQAAVEIPKTTLQESDSGSFCTFCPGVAELQTGSPFAMYPQAEHVAIARKEAYELKAALEKEPSPTAA